MEQLTIKELYSDLNKTLAKELLESKTYPWEVLPCIGEFIQKLGETLSEEEYEKKRREYLGGKISQSSAYRFSEWSGYYWKRCRGSSLCFYSWKCSGRRRCCSRKFYRAEKRDSLSIKCRYLTIIMWEIPFWVTSLIWVQVPLHPM